ncbi:MAG: DUF3078 domain-containing protein [Bacteroidetes bacterium]|nr:DUF3078 domain-containing protein [Bacteroidota bacterium]
MKIRSFFFVFLMAGSLLRLQSAANDTTKIWTRGAEIGLNASLSGTSPNWSGGAANNIAGNVFFNGFANAKKHHSSWDNVLKINVGQLSTQYLDNFGTKHRSTKKNIDNVFFDSKYGYSFQKVKWLSAYAGLNIQTQLLPGYSYGKDSNGIETRSQITSFLSQGQSMPAIGLEAKPREWFFARLGLGAIKQTYFLNQKLYGLRNETTIAGVKKGKYIYNEVGFQLQAGLNRDFGKAKQYNLKVNYLGFAPYNFAKSNSPLDSRVDVGFVAKISKYVNFNYTLISIFDKDLSKPGHNAWQNSWIVGLGFLYKL